MDEIYSRMLTKLTDITVAIDALMPAKKHNIITFEKVTRKIWRTIGWSAEYR